MRKTKLFGKVISAVITLAIFLSLAVPAFAASTHEKASFEITGCESVSGIANYLKISYRVVTSCESIDCLKSSIIKVDGKSLSANSFKKSADGKYVYEGSLYKFNLASAKVTFEAVDLHVSITTGKQEESYAVKDIVNAYPKAYIATIGSGLGLIKSTVVAISAKDDAGIKSIAVNGKVIADSSAINGAKMYNAIYDVYVDGYYSVVVTDTSGYKTNAYFIVKDGAIESQSAGSAPIVGDFGTYKPFYYYFGYSSLEEMIEENPYLYYYYILNNRDENSSNLYPFYPTLPNFPTLPNYPSIPGYPTLPNYPSINFPNLGEGNNNYLWYLYLNGMLDLENLDTSDPMYFYYIMAMLGTDENGNLNSENFSNMLIYQYLHGNAVSFTNGNKLIVSEVGETHKLTAPAVTNDKNAKYQWQKLVNGKWVDLNGENSNEYTLPAIVKGERYRVVISCPFYYSTIMSSTYVAGTTGVTAPSTPSTPSNPSTPTTPSDEFTADDITIQGLKNNVFAIKVGQTVTLMPSHMGYWNISNDLVTSTSNFGAIQITGAKTGFGLISFTGIDSEGNMAIKHIYVQVID